MLAGVVKAVIMAVILAVIATAPIFAPAEIGALVTAEELAASEAAGIGEGATLVEVGDGIGESVGEVSEGGEGFTSEPGSGDSSGESGESSGEWGDSSGECRDEYEEGCREAGECGDSDEEGGKDEGTVTTDKDGKKRVPGPKMPWITRPSYDKNGKPKRRGWHRVADGKTNVLANFLTPYTTTVSRHHYIWIRGIHH